MPSEAPAETFARDLTRLLDSFSETDPAAKQALTQLQMRDPRAFAVAAVRILGQTKTSPGSRYLVHLLVKEKMLPSSLLDERIAEPLALASLRTVTECGTNLQPMLELALNRALQDPPGHEVTARILRLLVLLAAISAPGLWNSFQLELMAYPDKFVRSKATILIGQSTRNAAWIGRRFLDRDPRELLPSL
jgi:hypothetical protein